MNKHAHASIRLLAAAAACLLLAACARPPAGPIASSGDNTFTFGGEEASAPLSTTTGDAVSSEESSGQTAEPGKEPDKTKRPTTASTKGTTGTSSAPIPPKNGMTEAKIQQVNGIPRLVIDGKQVQPVLAALNGTASEGENFAAVLRQIQKARDGGVNLLELTIDVSGVRYPDMYVDKLYNLMKKVYDANPAVKVILRFTIWLTPTYMGVPETEVGELNGGSKPYTSCSFASEKAVEGAKKMTRNLCQVVLQDDFLNKMVVGYQPCAGDAGEWFGPEYWSGGMDTSVHNRDAFRAYLKKVYGTDANLRKAWGDASVTLANAPLPDYHKLPSVIGTGGYTATKQYLMTDPANRIYVDYLDYTNQQRADILNALGRVIKEATGGKSLVSVFNAYHTEVYSAASGSFGARHLIDSPYIDCIAGPVSYEDRNEGGMGAYYTFVNSLALNGKLWIDEGDYRTTFKTAPGSNPTGGGQDGVGDSMPFIKSTENVYEVLKRQFGKQMVFSTGTWYFDLVERGWFDDAPFWKLNGQLAGLADKYQSLKKGSRPEVAIVMDESAMSLSGDGRLGQDLLAASRKVIYRSGLSFGLYMMEDLVAGKIPDAKLYVLLNPWRIDSAEAKKLEGVLHKKGKTTLWLYGAGDTSLADFRSLTGLNVQEKKGQSFDNTIKTAANAGSLLPGLTGNAALSGIGANPLYTVNEAAGVQVLGRYQNVSGSPAGYAMTEKDGWTSIFYGSSSLTLEVLKSAARKAGATVFSDVSSTSGDVLYADQGLAVLHTATAGNKTIRFPAGTTDVYEYFTGKWTSGGTVTLSCKQYQTLYFFYGKKADIQAAGIGK